MPSARATDVVVDRVPLEAHDDVADPAGVARARVGLVDAEAARAVVVVVRGGAARRGRAVPTRCTSACDARGEVDADERNRDRHVEPAAEAVGEEDDALVDGRVDRVRRGDDVGAAAAELGVVVGEDRRDRASRLSPSRLSKPKCW